VQPRRHAVVEDAEQSDQRNICGVELGERAEHDREGRLRAGVLDVLEVRARARSRRGRDLGACTDGNRGKSAGGLLDDAAVLDRARDAQVCVFCAVERREVTANVGSGEPLDVGARPDDALAERVVFEHETAGDVVGVDLDAVLVVVLVDLFEDELALEVDVPEARVGE
jgi:hypothetical protein